MSNSLSTTSAKENLKELKSKFLELTAEGNIEARTIDLLGITRGELLKICIDDPDFVRNIDEARKSRAEFWVSKIANSVDQDYEKDDIPNQKLKFDKLMFLAKADNPDRYGGNKSKIDISLDLKQFKLLPPDEAVRALTNDPFAIVEADFVEVKDEELL
jgi:TusA-related sulfurtransferase